MRQNTIFSSHLYVYVTVIHLCRFHCHGLLGAAWSVSASFCSASFWTSILRFNTQVCCSIRPVLHKGSRLAGDPMQFTRWIIVLQILYLTPEHVLVPFATQAMIDRSLSTTIVSSCVSNDKSEAFKGEESDVAIAEHVEDSSSDNEEQPLIMWSKPHPELPRKP